MIRFFSRILLMCLLAATIWGAGFIWFSAQIPLESNKKKQAIPNEKIAVVLTGGNGRIEHALNLMEYGAIRYLFISGVNESVNKKELYLSLPNESRSIFQEHHKRIILGKKARSTRGNANEVYNFFKDRRHNKRILLITTNYHLPRSVIEFERVMPDYTIIAEPVYSPQFPESWYFHKNSLMLAISEYHKLIASGIIYFSQHYELTS